MERRTLIKRLALLGLGAALPLPSLLARTAPQPAARPYHRFQLGTLEMTVVTDGHIVQRPVQPFLAPGAPAAEVRKLLQDNFRSLTTVDLGMNILIIRKAQKVILIDTGAGKSFGPNAGWLPASLKDAGFSPEEVTDVVISHAHPDHIGGLFSDNGSFVFPNAQVYISQIEHDFWMQDKPDFSKSKFSNKAMLAQIIAGTKQSLTALKDRLQFFDYKNELLGCMRLQLAPGHTPGHTIVQVFSGEEKLVHIADLLHSDVLLFPHPEWGFEGDTDFGLAATTRSKVMATLAADRTKVFSYHLAWPGIGHVKKKATGYEWIAETYAYPD